MSAPAKAALSCFGWCHWSGLQREGGGWKSICAKHRRARQRREEDDRVTVEAAERLDGPSENFIAAARFFNDFAERNKRLPQPFYQAKTAIVDLLRCGCCDISNVLMTGLTSAAFFST